MGYYKKIIYNCKQATFLLDKKAYQRISLRETFELRIHLAGCSLCRLYGQQSAMISKMISQLFSNALNNQPQLDDAFKQQLEKLMAEELKKNDRSM